MAQFKRGRTALVLACALVLAGALGAGIRHVGASSASFHGTTYDEVSAAPEFSLVDHNGRPVTLASYRGHPVLMFFGYTHCPDVCPLTLNKIGRSLRDTGAEDVRVLLVTNDPARDTPAVLRDYAARFGGQVIGLTGDSVGLERARAGYGAFFMPPVAHEHGAAGRMMSHSSVVYGIDRAGNLQVVIPEGAKQEELTNDVRALARLR
ncbi:MAG TPA: SCO family protein [Longimicrobium sp.]|nr:SCO family protein [Longimicrobium sp.]